MYKESRENELLKKNVLTLMMQFIMRFLIIAVLLIHVGCSNNKIKSPVSSEDKILYEEKDKKGRLIKRVIAGNIPGEDKFIHIIRYDSLGREMEKYGINPYDQKFKEFYLYDTKTKETRSYSFNDFKGSDPDKLYQLKDTLEPFKILKSNISAISITKTSLKNDSVLISQYYQYDERTGKFVDEKGNFIKEK